jgi:hypothetical protein
MFFTSHYPQDGKKPVIRWILAKFLPSLSVTVSMFPLSSPLNSRRCCDWTLLDSSVGNDISEQSEPQMGRGCVKKLIFDLCLAAIAIAELIACIAS